MRAWLRRAGISMMVELCLPWVVFWAWRTERTALRCGRVLTDREVERASSLSVRKLESVRVLTVPEVPMPGARWLQRLAARRGFDASRTSGLCLRYAIFLREGAGPSSALRILTHELVHTTQYERLGGHYPFLRQYLIECLRDGYASSALEREAVDREAEIAEAELS